MEQVKSRLKPSGISTIEHKVRHLLGLTVEEYIMVDLIYQFNKRYKPPALLTAEKYHKAIGFTLDEIKRVGRSLKEKGLLISCETQKRYVTTSLWNDNFDDDAQFNMLWEIHPWGSKQEAKQNFMKMKKLIPFDELLVKLQEYVNSNDNPQYLSHLKKWLDPKLKKWEDPIAYNGRANRNNITLLDNPQNNLFQ